MFWVLSKMTTSLMLEWTLRWKLKWYLSEIWGENWEKKIFLGDTEVTTEVTTKVATEVTTQWQVNSLFGLYFTKLSQWATKTSFRRQWWIPVRSSAENEWSVLHLLIHCFWAPRGFGSHWPILGSFGHGVRKSNH